jgi:hypothetical protein
MAEGLQAVTLPPNSVSARCRPAWLPAVEWRTEWPVGEELIAGLSMAQ